MAQNLVVLKGILTMEIILIKMVPKVVVLKVMVRGTQLVRLVLLVVLILQNRVVLIVVLVLLAPNKMSKSHAALIQVLAPVDIMVMVTTQMFDILVEIKHAVVIL
jgi:hypothetical protein